MPLQRWTGLVALGASLALALAACGDGDDGTAGASAGGDGGLRVVTTTALLAELAEQVAGENVGVRSLIPAGVDLHSFEPPTEAARVVAEADLLVVNGYNLEESMLPVVLENRREGTPVLVAAAGLKPLAGGHHDGEEEHDQAPAGDASDLVSAEGDPHFWMDVSNTVHYVENIRDALVDLDAEHAVDYEARAATYIEELQALDAEVRETLVGIPEDQRRVVTFHDAYQYLAAAYGLELTATVLGSNPNQEASAADIADLIELVRREQVPAIFAEAEFSSQTLDMVAAETGARVLTLFDTYTEEVTTYHEMMRRTADALVEGLAP